MLGFLRFFMRTENINSVLHKYLIPNGNAFSPKGAQNYNYIFDLQNFDNLFFYLKSDLTRLCY